MDNQNLMKTGFLDLASLFILVTTKIQTVSSRMIEVESNDIRLM